jgi:mycothiol maleylpyruvate isomerase-like protein
VRHTKSKVIERTQHEYRQLDRLVRSLKPADWRRLVPRPESKDPWTVKDSLAHILYWKEHTARVFRREKRPSELRGLNVNQGNALIYQRWRNRRPADVVAWHRRVQDDVIRTLRAQPEGWYTGKERGVSWPGDLVGHSAGHRVRDIEAALKS